MAVEGQINVFVGIVEEELADAGISFSLRAVAFFAKSRKISGEAKTSFRVL
jgi:hypothetical protein